MPATGLILCCVNPHFLDRKTKAPRGKANQSTSWEVEEP